MALARDPSPLVAALETTPLTFVHGNWKLSNFGCTDDGRTVTAALFKTLLDEEMDALRQTLPSGAYDGGRFAEAISLFADMTLSDKFEEFLTLPAYQLLD